MKKMNYMKRWLLLALSCLCMGFLSARAETAPMLDSLGSFNYGFPPTDWKVLNQSGASSWGISYSGITGNNALVYANASAENDTWLITPQLQPVAGKSTLAFYLRSDKDTMDNTVFEVLVSPTKAEPELFTVIETITNTAKGSGFTAVWTKHTVDMSAYEGQNVFVAFRAHKNNLAQVGLDSVAGLPLAVFANDINLKTISLNPDYVVFKGEQRTVRVTAENRGNAEASVIGTLKVSFNGSEQENTLTATKSIAAGQTDMLEFEYTFAEVGEYQLQVSVPADDNTINDTIRLGVKTHPTGTLVEDFHSGKTRPPKDWAIYTNTDPYGTSGWWSSLVGATSSNGYVSWGSLNNLSASKGEPAVRALITPQLRIKDGDNLSFSAKLSGLSYIGVKPADAMKIFVLVSQTTADMDSFTDTVATYGLEGENALTESWKEYMLDLSKFKDKNIFVAFMAVDRHGLGVYVYLDEVGGEIEICSFTNDARVVMAQIDEPTRYWFAGDKIMVHGRVENHGTGDLGNLNVSLKVNGTEAATQTVASLAPGAFSDTLDFEYTIPAAGTFNMEVCVPSDQNNINNTAGFSLQTYPAGYFIEGFEEVDYSTFPPRYWSCERTSFGGYGWSVMNSAGNTQCYKGNAHASSQAGYKLITPLLHITKTDSLCFWANTTWATCEYAVLTSVNAKDWDTLGKVSMTGDYGVPYTLYKFFFADKDDAFFGNRYVAIVSLMNSMNIDEVYGPMLASRDDQFALVNAFVNPSEVAVAGKPFTVKAVVFNDGTQAASKQVTLYAQGEQLAQAQTIQLAAGAYDTVSFTVTVDKAASDMAFVVELPEDASAFDNTFSFTSHIYQPELWRFEDGFEDVTHPFWIFKGNNAWTSKPTWQPLEPASGNEYLQLSIYSAKDALAVSPYLDLRYGKYEVSVDIYRESNNPTNPDRIELGFGAAPVWENVVFIDSVNRVVSEYPVNGTEGWNHYTFTVDLPQMQHGFLMLHPIVILNQYGNPADEKMRFDNLVIRPILDKDAELVALSMPADTVWGYDSVKMTLNAVLLNSGTENLTSAVIRYGVDEQEMGSLTWNGNLAAGKDTVVELSGKVAVSYKESLRLYAQVEATGDANPLNNRTEKNIYVKKAYELPFVADFENEDWSKDWQNFTYSTDVRQSWFRDTTDPNGITAPFGKACANSASLDDELGAVNPDNWLVTPGLFIKYSKAYLSFYVQASDVTAFAEKFQVLVSTRSNLDSAFFVPVHTQMLQNDQLQHIVLELNGYRNEVIHVAFRHFDCTDQYRLLLDSVYVYDPQGYQVTATVNPTQAGTVQGTGYFLAGEEVSLTAIANTGYYFTGWFKDGDSITNRNPYSFICEGNVALEARFAEKTFAITLNAGEGGSVNPAGTVNVKEGEDLTVSITANEGYQIEDVKVDGVSVGAVETYTFEAVAATHSLTAAFKKDDVANETLQADMLSVLPNPFVSELRVSSPMPVKAVRMVNLQGKVVFQTNVGGASTFSFNLNLPDGMYIVLVETVSGQRLMQRVVKASN